MRAARRWTSVGPGWPGTGANAAPNEPAALRFQISFYQALPGRREQTRSVVVENLVLGRFREGQCLELGNVLPDVPHSEARPVRAEKHLVSNFLEPWEIFQQQFLPWNTGDIHVHVFVP